MTDSRPSMAALNFFSKSISCCLVVLFLTWPLAALAQEVLLGTVVSVDREKGNFVIELNGAQENMPEHVTIQAAKVKDQFFFPECVEVGVSVRIWGQYGEDGTGTFQAETVRGPGLGRYDKSGIRSRLNRGHGRQYGRQSGRSRNRR